MIIQDRDFIFTSESVSEGHPDKVSDQISDAVLDAYLTADPKARVACETMVTTGLVVIAGEVSAAASAHVDIRQVARDVIEKIGYTDSDLGFDYKSCGILVSLNKQSPDIAMGVDSGSDKEQGAGDQGMMFGYACKETPELMPLSIHLANKLVETLASLRKSGDIKGVRPDSKSQVSVRYESGAVAGIEAIVLSTQHDPFGPSFTKEHLEQEIQEKLIKKVIPADLLKDYTKYYINPTGNFVKGGPDGDCGLTGRKIIVDTYGGWGAHGGGAFSGKDPSKVDRSAAYMARYIAKNLVAAGAAERILVQLAYAIGVAEPVSVFIDTYGTGVAGEDTISSVVRKVFGLKPAEIIKQLDLLKPVYQQTAAYGHFGRENFSWEKTDRVSQIKEGLGI